MRPLRTLKYVALVLAGSLALGVAAIYCMLRASLPQIEGELSAPGLTAAAVVERDAQGTPTLRAATRRELAFTTGFAHVQDRFFQMDLMRRAAAGELAGLLGSVALEADKKLRVHGFRRIAGEVIEHATAAQRELLEAYAAGANFALASADARPWEYTLLRVRPAPWRSEDSVLVAFSMYLDLNNSNSKDELARAQLRAALPQQLFAFMHPPGTQWDAPLAGGTWQSAPIPGPEVLDLRAGAARRAALLAPRAADPWDEPVLPGSNSWAVAGSHTKNGAALLANDMHLGLRLPHVWYRVRLIAQPTHDLVGVTLPGLPLLIAGSNRRVAWGYTNSYGDWTDLVIVEVDPHDAQRYLVGEGSEPFVQREERIEVRGGAAVTLNVRATRWGPVIGADETGRPLVLAWTAHHRQATNLHMMDLETATTVEQALDAANRAGAPVQNIIVADAQGRIGWSLLGQVPVRGPYDSTVPSSWRVPGTGWTGWRAPQEYPRIVDPAAGRLWTANARTIDVETWLGFLGDGGYDLGARAAQIRDGLLGLRAADRDDMNAIQLDDRALFLTRWRDLFLELLDEPALTDRTARAAARQLMQEWSGRAAAQDAGYRIVRAARLQVRKDVFESLTSTARGQFPDAAFAPSAQFEGPLWELVTRRPLHLLDPRYESWEAALLASLDRTLQTLQQECKELTACTWGAQNTLRMRHPLSAALPLAARWLDMPAVPMPGDLAMPRVQGATFGASQRLVVSPGREAEGYFQMPGGPVDHPLSPFYGAGHAAWARGEPVPLLPGEPQHVLRLQPAGAQ